MLNPQCLLCLFRHFFFLLSCLDKFCSCVSRFCVFCHHDSNHLGHLSEPNVFVFVLSQTWPAWLILSVTKTSWGNFLGAVRLFTPGMSLYKNSVNSFLRLLLMLSSTCGQQKPQPQAAKELRRHQRSRALPKHIWKAPKQPITRQALTIREVWF